MGVDWIRRTEDKYRHSLQASQQRNGPFLLARRLRSFNVEKRRELPFC